MDVERTARDAWAIPQLCSVCGEPHVDGNPYRATVTLDHTMGTSGLMNEIDTVTTRTLTVEFPRCASCEAAHKAKERRTNIAAAISVLVGLLGCVFAAVANGGWLPWVIVAGVWFAIMYATQTILDRMWQRSADADAQRRAKLSGLPVQIKKAGGRGLAQRLRFRFANDEYGAAFDTANP